MANIVAIVSDDRVRRQVEQFVGQITSSENRIATFKDFKEFNALYFPPLKPPPTPEEVAAAATAPVDPNAAPPPEEKKEDGPVDLRLFSTVHVLIYAIDSIGEKVQTFAPSLMRKMKERGYWPENNRTRMMLLKYEDDQISKLDVLLPELDDLVYIPLDRLVFLQKLEMILGLPKKVKGSFLFTQALEQEIEISKIVRLEKFNDVGLAVRNPLPLQPGIRAKFYVQLPGDKEIIRFFAKALRSVPHPELPNQYICYFNFFGVRKKEITKIRQWLSGKGHHYKGLHHEDRERYKLKTDDLMAVEMAGPMRNIVLLDPADDQLQAISSQINGDMSNIQITTETSYAYFVHKYIQSKSKTMDPPKPTKPEEIPGGALQLKVNVETKNLVSSNHVAKEEEVFFGHPLAAHLKAGTSDWWKLFKNEENDLILQGALDVLKEHKSSAKVTTIVSATNEHHAVKIKISPDSDAANFVFDVLPVNAAEMADKLGGSSSLGGIDVMVVDTAFIPADFPAWIEFLRTNAAQKGLIKRPEDLKLILISDRENRLDRAWLDSPHVLGLILKPLDTRQLLMLLSIATGNNLTVYNFDNIGWADMANNIHMSREIVLEEVGEFGATLRSPTPFRPGSYFFLRKLIFDNAPNQCLAGRVYFCEPHPKEKSQFQISVFYYGINDAFLKFARTWIRENYAHSKAQGGG